MTKRGFGGRPKTKEAALGEKITVSVRITQEMKQRLEETAAATGRSQSQEVELRLDRSFDREDLLPDVLSLAFGQDAAGLLMAIGLLMTKAGEQHTAWLDGEGRWLNDSVAFHNVRCAIVELLNATDPRREGALVGTGETGIQVGKDLIVALALPPGVFNKRFVTSARMVAQTRDTLGTTIVKRITRSYTPRKKGGF